MVRGEAMLRFILRAIDLTVDVATARMLKQWSGPVDVTRSQREGGIWMEPQISVICCRQFGHLTQKRPP